MQAVTTWVKPAADRLLRRPLAARAVGRVGGIRGRGLALLWHRIGPEGPRTHETVRTVATADFADQLDVLGRLGDIVPLAELEQPRRGPRPRFALTFDDDDVGHVEHTLPLLRACGVPATFFLSGRWNVGDGPYWWELLESRIRSEGTISVAAAYGLPDDADAVGIAQALTGTPHADDLGEVARRSGPPPMTREQAAELVAGGMEIGFHTRQHPSLPTLGEHEAQLAVTAGRDELAADLGVSIDRFAYPHGHVDDRIAAVVRSGGYRSAWTTRKRAVSRGQDRMYLGRWDLGHRSLDAFRAAVLRGLARPSP